MPKRLCILAVFFVLALLSACATPPIPPATDTALPVPRETTPVPSAAPSTTPRPVLGLSPTRSIPTARISRPTFEPTPTLTPTRTKAPSSGQHLRALHQSGQTFLVWDEAPGDTTRYRIYRSNRPVVSGQEENLLWLGEVGQGSANFYTDRFHNPATHLWDMRFFNRLILQDNAEELPEGLGLFVWTVSPEDLGGENSGQGYYVVSAMVPDGAEQILPGYTIGPVDEAVADPLPVETRVRAGKSSHVLIQYMNLRDWNATFHAPNTQNEFYGLHPTDPRFDSTLQYAFDYVVYEPSCSQPVANAPVVLVLDDYTRSRPALPEIDADMLSWCAYKIYPFDTGDTRWFGFAAFHDYRQDTTIEAGDALGNFTEARVLRMVYDLIRRPYGIPVDQNRIYVIGRGSGGKAAVNFAARYGSIFAAAFANAPVAEIEYFDAIANSKQMTDLTGDLDLPVISSGPGNWADRIQQDEAAGNGGTAKDMPVFLGSTWLAAAPLGIQYDARSPAWRFRDDTLETLATTRQAWFGAVTGPETLAPLDYRGLLPNFQNDSSGHPFYGLLARRNEAILAFSNNRSEEQGWMGAYNGFRQTILWSSSWQPWHGSGPLDLLDRLEFNICAVDPARAGESKCGTGWEQVVDITPRRLQHFLVVPGMHIRWENLRLNDGAVINSGRATVRGDGTFTLSGVTVLPEGNKLVMYQEPERGENQK